MKKTKKSIVIITTLLFTAAALTAVYIRVNPTWKSARLKIESSEKTAELPLIAPDGTTLETRIAPPEGFERVSVGEDSFGAYLRKYPMLPDGIKLPVYDGTAKDSLYTAAVFDISLGDEGYQQCADSIIRLYSDYFFENGQLDRISFQFSNGDECSYERWRKGRRMLVLGDFSCEIPATLPDDSEQEYRNYLKEVMNYAGTLSLQKESEVIAPDELRTGDIICSDSHVVMIVDEAVNGQGERCYLIGQSFIPAVCFHIIADPGSETSPWFTQEQLEAASFNIGGFGFERGNIRRWKDGF